MPGCRRPSSRHRRTPYVASSATRARSGNLVLRPRGHQHQPPSQPQQSGQSGHGDNAEYVDASTNTSSSSTPAANEQDGTTNEQDGTANEQDGTTNEQDGTTIHVQPMRLQFTFESGDTMTFWAVRSDLNEDIVSQQQMNQSARMSYAVQPNNGVHYTPPDQPLSNILPDNNSPAMASRGSESDDELPDYEEVTFSDAPEASAASPSQGRASTQDMRNNRGSNEGTSAFEAGREDVYIGRAAQALNSFDHQFQGGDRDEGGHD